MSISEDKQSPPSNLPETSSSAPPKRPQSFLSSVFSSRKPFSGRNLFISTSESKSGKNIRASNSVLEPKQEKSHGFHGILSDLSSKLEAALTLSLEALDSDSSSNCDEFSCKNSATNESGSQPELRRGSLPNTSTDQLSRHRYTKRKAARHKDRSVYGQPEIDPFETKQKTWKNYSQESLDTVDSGQSLGNSSSLSAGTTEYKLSSKNDPFYVFRHTESIGIGSESDPCGQSTSLDSSDAESVPEGRGMYFGRSGSGSSLHSWASSPSNDSQPDDLTLEAMEFMKRFVQKIFFDSNSITFEEKAKFGDLSQNEIGRIWFSRCVNGQRVHNKLVAEDTFYSLVQYFAIVLFECAEADDFSPAKSIMNMCFTFYYDNCREGAAPMREYLFSYLKDQPIWRSIRFWNAAFFDAVQCERANREIPIRNELGQYDPEDLRDERNFQENIFFGQLGTFTYNIYAFGLSKAFATEFLHKQCTIASLSKEHVLILQENIARMYSGDIGKEYS